MFSGRKDRRIGWREGQLLLASCVAVGLLTFAVALTQGLPLRAWQAFHVNFLFWTGLAFAGVVISAVFRITDSRWGFAVRRLGECGAAFLPLSLLLYVGVVLGHGTVAPHGHHLNHARALWLEPTGLLVRDGAALLALALLALAYVYYSLRPDLDPAAPTGGKLVALLTRGWRGPEAEAKRSRRLTAVLSPLLIVAYALVFTLLGVDQVMALDLTWMSTLFGAYFFVVNLYLGWATLALLASLARTERWGGLESAVTTDVLHNLGKLMFAFCFLSMDFFWSQFLTIWYGNLPEETPFILRRIRVEPWNNVAAMVLLFLFATPFIALLFKRIKRDARTLAVVGLLVIVMVWVERFLLVAPSIWRPDGFWFGPVELGVTLGFLGLAGLAYGAALRRVPLLPAPAVIAAQRAEEADGG